MAENGKTGLMRVLMPTALSKVLKERGNNAVRIYITDEGILLKPFISNERRPQREITVPEWMDA